ncbi:hypothetical protein LTR53_003579 [Teratosphaeriaceae sp. CCFEE 6253]|nr:hypothetical protein LTR53_003579 [Teratosphaeriaceae sp. CCFEE 6253]
MAQTITEDDLYRTSSQYRLWSFSPESLVALRQQTHDLALDRPNHYSIPPEACLTATEELQLVRRYTTQLLTTADHFKFPPSVKATAVQYLHRFYLSNSVLTYPPKEIYKTVLWLACKTEATHESLGNFARRIASSREVVLAPEYKVMQALRFTLDVRQPYGGLKGALMEMLNLAEGRMGEVDGVDVEDGARGLKEEMMGLESPPHDARTQWKPPKSDILGAKHLNDRINAAYAAARTILDGPALLTDAYFHFTPSQLLLAALSLADPPLTSFYLRTKLPLTSDLRPKILATITSCASLLASYSEGQILSKEERTALEEKLEKCRDPGTRDLVGASERAKRGGERTGEEEEERMRKKKVAREQHAREGNELFGPSIGSLH